MPRSTLLVALLVALAGCAGGPASPTSSPASPSDSPTAVPIPSDSPTSTTTPRQSGTIAYAVRAGGPALKEFRSVNVTFATVAFQNGTRHQCHGKLAEGTFTPTPTPEMDLGLDCVVFVRNVTLDLTDATEATALGEYTVPSVVAEDTYLVVKGLNGTLKGGTHVPFGEDDDFDVIGSGHRIGDRILYGVTFSVAKNDDGEGYWLSYGGFAPDPSLDPSTSYTFDVEGEIRNGETVTISVSRNGQPANTVLHIEGAERERYETGSDGEVAVEVTGAEVFEVEVQRPDAV